MSGESLLYHFVVSLLPLAAPLLIVLRKKEMHTRYRTIGTNLLLGGILTIIWAFWCPKYQPFREQYVTKNFNEEGSRLYYKIDLGIFVAGEIVIWSVIWGVFFLTRKQDAERVVRGNGG